MPKRKAVDDDAPPLPVRRGERRARGAGGDAKSDRALDSAAGNDDDSGSSSSSSSSVGAGAAPSKLQTGANARMRPDSDDGDNTGSATDGGAAGPGNGRVAGLRAATALVGPASFAAGAAAVDGSERPPRHNKTAEQRVVLERWFASNARPAEQLLAEIALDVGLTVNATARWFRNRRFRPLSVNLSAKGLAAAAALEAAGVMYGMPMYTDGAHAPGDDDGDDPGDQDDQDDHGRGNGGRAKPYVTSSSSATTAHRHRARAHAAAPQAATAATAAPAAADVPFHVPARKAGGRYHQAPPRNSSTQAVASPESTAAEAWYALHAVFRPLLNEASTLQMSLSHARDLMTLGIDPTALDGAMLAGLGAMFDTHREYLIALTVRAQLVRISIDEALLPPVAATAAAAAVPRPPLSGDSTPAYADYSLLQPPSLLAHQQYHHQYHQQHQQQRQQHHHHHQQQHQQHRQLQHHQQQQQQQQQDYQLIELPPPGPQHQQQQAMAPYYGAHTTDLLAPRQHQGVGTEALDAWQGGVPPTHGQGRHLAGGRAPDAANIASTRAPRRPSRHYNDDDDMSTWSARQQQHHHGPADDDLDDGASGLVGPLAAFAPPAAAIPPMPFVVPPASFVLRTHTPPPPPPLPQEEEEEEQQQQQQQQYDADPAGITAADVADDCGDAAAAVYAALPNDGSGGADGDPSTIFVIAGSDAVAWTGHFGTSQLESTASS